MSLIDRSVYQDRMGSSMDRRGSGALRTASSVAWAALRELQADMQHLNRRLDKLSSSSSSHEAVVAQVIELREPMDELDAQMTALRDAVRMRFEPIEERLGLLEEVQHSLKKRCSLMQNDSEVVRSQSDAAGSKVAVRRSEERMASGMVGEVKSDYSSSKRRSVSPLSLRNSSHSPGPSNKRLRLASPADASASAPANETTVGKVSCLVSGFTIPKWAASAKRQLEPPPGRMARDLTNVVQAIREVYRDRGMPADHAIDGTLVAAKLRAQHPGVFETFGVSKWKELVNKLQRWLALYLLLPPLKRDLKRCCGEFVLLNEVPYYSRPINPPSSHQQITALCKQIKLNPVEWFLRQDRLPLRCTPEQPDRQLKPESRVRTSSPIARLEPSVREIAQTSTQELASSSSSGMMIEPEHNQHHPPRSSSNWAEQTRISSPHSLDTSSRMPLFTLEQERRGLESGFPGLDEPLSPEWEARLSQPSFYFDIVDLLRHRLRHGEVDAGQFHTTLRFGLGNEFYTQLLNACGGTQRFYGVAARLIKIARHAGRNVLILHDSGTPFWREEDNDEYFTTLTDRVSRRASQSHMLLPR